MKLTPFLERGKQEELNQNQLIEIRRAQYTSKNFAQLTSIFEKCKKIIEAEEGIRSDISFKEMSKIILVKIFEEKRGRKGEINRFSTHYLRMREPILETFKKLFNDVKSTYPIYDETKEKVAINLHHEESLLRILQLLENWSFSGVDEDIKGMLYEIFLKVSLRGELGQYFTPKELVNFMIAMVNPHADNTIHDPACGSGGFLIHSFLEVKNGLSGEEEYPHMLNVHTYDEPIKDFVSNGLWGFEIDSDLHLLAKINLIMHADSCVNISNQDFLSYETKDLCGKFDIILTNPPFSFPVENRSILSNYELGKRKKSEQIDILYVEKCLELLKKEGILGIVLPEGLLNLPSYEYFRKYILKESEVLANISIPAGAFLPFGQSNAKTCIVFLKKRGNTKLEYAFMADAAEIGYDVGKKTYNRHSKNDLMEFVTYFSSEDIGFKTTEWGGRCVFVNQSSLDPTRLDAKYYFMKRYISGIRKSGILLKKLSEIATVAHPRTLPSRMAERDFYYLEVPDISEGTGAIANIRRIKGKEIIGHKVRFRAGDILFTRIYPDKNRIAIVPEEIKDGVCSTEISVIRPINPGEIDPYALIASLKSSIVMNQVKDLTAGSSSSRPRLSEDLLREILVPILDPDARKEIAEKMKEILEEYWNSAQKYLKGYSDVMSYFGDIIETNLVTAV